MGFFHEFSGWVMFLVSLGCLFIVHLAMACFRRTGDSMKNPRFWTVVLLLTGRRYCCTPAVIAI